MAGCPFSTKSPSLVTTPTPSPPHSSKPSSISSAFAKISRPEVASMSSPPSFTMEQEIEFFSTCISCISKLSFIFLGVSISITLMSFLLKSI